MSGAPGSSPSSARYGHAGLRPVFLTSRMGRMIPGPHLQGSLRDPGVHCLNFGCSWQSSKELHKLPNAGDPPPSVLSGCGGLGPRHVFLKCARRA